MARRPTAENPATAGSARRGPMHRRWELWAALGAAFLGFELAVDLAVALPAACLLFGWNDAATAWWCLRRDPIRSRGWLAAGLYGASAWLKVGAGTFGVFALTAAIAGVAEARDRSAVGPARGAPPAFVVAAVFVAVGSLMAAWGLANLTCGVALWKRRKLWLGPEAGLARRQGTWPPWAADESGSSGRSGATNRMQLIVWLVFIPWMTALILALTLVSALALAPLVNTVAGEGVATGVMIAAMLVSVIGVPILVLHRIDGRLAAASPFEAWELEAP